MAVSNGYISKVKLDCSDQVRKELIVHMGIVHSIVVNACDEYFVKNA